MAAWVMGCAAAFAAAAHTHVEIRLREGRLALELYDFESGSFDPAVTPVLVGPAARRANPPALTNLLGATPAVWILPQNEDPRLGFLGIGAESIPRSALAGGNLTLVLKAVDGPGGFVVFQTLPFGGPKLMFSSRDGLPDALALRAGPGTHLHCNWAFTTPGTYRATFMARGTLAATGAPADSPDTVYTFVVPPPEAPMLGIRPGTPPTLRLPGGVFGPAVVEAASGPDGWEAALSVEGDGMPHVLPLPVADEPAQWFRMMLP